MTNLHERFRRHLFPTYEEQMAEHEVRKRAGIEALQKSGFQIGDTVYIDATIPAVIESASLEVGVTLHLQVYVSMDTDVFAEYMGVEKPRGQRIEMPCSIHNFWKRQLTGSDLKRWQFLKKYGLFGKVALNDIPDEAIE